MPGFTAEIAANRFGLGAREGEIAAAGRDPQGWLLAQLQPLAFDARVGDSRRAVELAAEQRRQRARSKRNKTGDSPRDEEGGARPPAGPGELQKLAHGLVLDTLEAAVQTTRPFATRLFDFYSNHFSVSVTGPRMRGLAPTLEREAIAPHVAGRFADMLLAVERHPAMLVYLNNAPSIGPNSRAGKRRGKGLNENLAREILELHTLGVNGGYQQADVRELAQAITGWSVGGPGRKESAGFQFRPDMHEPGARTVLAQRYAEGGLEQGEAILRALAAHPSTARHVCFKLARHVVADEPAPELVDAMVATWRSTDGDLRAVATTLVRHRRSWELPPRKLKNPREFVVSAGRALSGPRPELGEMNRALTALGQSPFSAGSPAGFGDVASAWDGSEALLSRIDWAEQLGTGRTRPGEPIELARAALGQLLDARTVGALRGAASREQGLALFLMSPEFQRR